MILIFLKRFFHLILLLYSTIVFIKPSYSQDIEIMEKFMDSYWLKIDGKDYIALTDVRTREKEKVIATLRTELAFANKRMKADSVFIAAFDQTIKALGNNPTLQKSHIQESERKYEKEITDLKDELSNAQREILQANKQTIEELLRARDSPKSSWFSPQIMVGLIGAIATVIAATLGYRAAKSRR